MCCMEEVQWNFTARRIYYKRLAANHGRGGTVHTSGNTSNPRGYLINEGLRIHRRH
jgi:hypothetical protein